MPRRGFLNSLAGGMHLPGRSFQALTFPFPGRRGHPGAAPPKCLRVPFSAYLTRGPSSHTSGPRALELRQPVDGCPQFALPRQTPRVDKAGKVALQAAPRDVGEGGVDVVELEASLLVPALQPNEVFDDGRLALREVGVLLADLEGADGVFVGAHQDAKQV